MTVHWEHPCRAGGELSKVLGVLPSSWLPALPCHHGVPCARLLSAIPLLWHVDCNVISVTYIPCACTHTHTHTHPPPYSLHHNHICLCKTHRALSSAIPCRIKPAHFSLPSWSLVWSNPALLSSWFLANPHLPCPTPSRPFPFQALTKPYDLQQRLQTASHGIWDVCYPVPLQFHCPPLISLHA